MDSFGADLLAAFAVMFVAELGDKTQLLAAGFGARVSRRTMVAGLALGFGTAGAFAALVGGLLGVAFPERPVQIVGGVVFLAVAVAIVARPEDDDDDQPKAMKGRSAVIAIATAIAFAELGDKTQIATATLAAQRQPVAVWLGATLGEVCSAMVGAQVGRVLLTRVSPRVVRLVSALLFAAFGVAALIGF
ncbi:MAG: TMEM165/GDT1 family protein [Acidimicrobiales bacterium]